MVVTAVHTVAVAVAPMVVLVAWAVLAQYVLFGPVTQDNSHLHIQATYPTLLLMFLLLLVAEVVVV
jgi:cell shape-determining protein MreD